MTREALLATSPAAAVFDVDGLLVDTESCWTRAEAEVFARRGLPFGPEQKARLLGRSAPELGRRLAGMFTEPGREGALTEELLSLVGDALVAGVAAMPGAPELVEAAAARVPVAAASNSPRPLVALALRHAGLEELLPVTLCLDDVVEPKPDPELYLAACAALARAPSCCVAFEDSPTGVRAAAAAGIPCVAVPAPGSGEPPEARLVVSALSDPSLLDWVRTW